MKTTLTTKSIEIKDHSTLRSIGEGSVDVNGKEQKFIVTRRRHYVNGEYHDNVQVEIENINIAALKNIGIEIDTASVEEEFFAAIKAYEKKERIKEHKKRIEAYDNSYLHELKNMLAAAGIETKYNWTKAEFITEKTMTSYFALVYEEKYKKKKIGFSVSVEIDKRNDYRFVIHNTENCGIRSNRVSTMKAAVNKLKIKINESRQEIDNAEATQQRNVSELQKKQEKFGDDVKITTVYKTGWRGKMDKTKCYKVEKLGGYNRQSVSFDTSGDKVYIRSFDLHLTEDQLKTVLNWVREAEVS
jgi:hypothetical protein